MRDPEEVNGLLKIRRPFRDDLAKILVEFLCDKGDDW
jgi:hypothetical protein